MSAFFWFAQDERPKVREKNPSYAVGDIAKELGRRWASASPKTKTLYEGKAEKDRERYVKEKQAFQQKLKDEKNGILPVTAPKMTDPVKKIEDSEDDDENEEPEEETHHDSD